MSGLNIIERLIFSIRPLYLALLLILCEAMRGGIWWSPGSRNLHLLAADPFVNPFTSFNQDFFDNWLGPFLAWLLFRHSDFDVVFVYLLSSVFFIIVTLTSLRRSLEIDHWRKAICLFFCLPVSWTHLYLITYDSLTLALMALVLATLETPWLTMIFGIGLGLQHLQHAVIGLAGLLFVIVVGRRSTPKGPHGNNRLIWRPFPGRWRPWKRSGYSRGSPNWDRKAIGVSAALAGVLLGEAILLAIMRANGIVVTLGRWDYLTSQARSLVKANAWTAPVFVFGLFGAAWLVVFAYVGQGPYRRAFGAVLAGCAGVTFLTFDVTRVFAVISYPAVAFCLLYDERWLARLPRPHVAALLLAWLTVPWLYDYVGRLRMSVFPYDLALVAHAVTGWPAIPADLVWWPFKGPG